MEEEGVKVEKEKTEVTCLDSFHVVGQIAASGADGKVGEGRKPY